MYVISSQLRTSIFPKISFTNKKTFYNKSEIRKTGSSLAQRHRIKANFDTQEQLLSNLFIIKSHNGKQHFIDRIYYNLVSHSSVKLSMS